MLGLNTYADPWVLQSLLSGDSLGWVDSQHLVDQIFSLRSHRVPFWGGKLNTPTHSHTDIKHMTHLAEVSPRKMDLMSFTGPRSALLE